jgi:integrase
MSLIQSEDADLSGKTLMAPHLKLVTPNSLFRSVETNRILPLRKPNTELRTREYLTSDEVEKLIKAAKQGGRYSQRDATLILIAYRHGLRAKEIAELEWSQVEFSRSPCLHVRRAKNGKPSVHPLRGDEIRALRELQRHSNGPYVFQPERGGSFVPSAINLLIKRIGIRAAFEFPVHIHMLRHACGYALANMGHDTRAIQDWLGHRSIQHTVRYTELSPTKFKDFWRD